MCFACVDAFFTKIWASPRIAPQMKRFGNAVETITNLLEGLYLSVILTEKIAVNEDRTQNHRHNNNNCYYVYAQNCHVPALRSPSDTSIVWTTNNTGLPCYSYQGNSLYNL